MLVINFALYDVLYPLYSNNNENRSKKERKKKRDGWKKRDKKRSETRCETESGKVYRVGGKDGNDKQEKGRRNFFSKRKRYCTSINLKKKKREEL